MDVILETVGSMMRDVGQTVEGPMREGYARAFAKRFDRAQLGEIESFFSTPTGSAFASESMTLFSDPQVMSSIMGTMPAMFEQMGDMEGGNARSDGIASSPSLLCRSGMLASAPA